MFGDQIKKLRLAKNMTQVQLAKQLGVTKQAISNWENDNIMPSIDMLRKLAIYFHCTADYLLELEDTDRVFVEIGNLTMEQAAHIQQLIDDLKDLNDKANRPEHLTDPVSSNP